MTKKPIIPVKAKEIRDLDKDLTFKQKAFLKLYFETGNATKAALQSYETDDVNSAAVIASMTLRKLKSPVKTFMEMNGFSLKHLMSVLAGGLQAKRIKTSLTEPDRLVDDWPTRHKYLETAARWLGVEEKEDQQIPVQQTNLQINFTPLKEKNE